MQTAIDERSAAPAGQGGAAGAAGERRSSADPAAERSVRLRRLQRRRRAWLQVHLWLGLFAGAVLAIVGLTGSILVFYQELDELLNPATMTVAEQPGGRSAFEPIDAITAAARKALPDGATMTFGYYPRNDRVAYHLFYDVPIAGGDAALEKWHVFVNPYTAEVTGTRLVKSATDWVPRDLISFIFELHYQLLMSWEVGGLIVGTVAVFLIVSALTGLILWWPLTGKWRLALTFKRHAGSERFNIDLHRTTGFYSLVVLLALLVSGLYMNLPNQFYTMVRFFSPAVDRYAVTSGPSLGREPITFGDAVAVVERRYPGGRLDWLYDAPDADSAYTVCKRGLNHLDRFVGRCCIVIDRYSGAILHAQAPDAGTGGDYFVLWQWPLHSGQAFGMTGRILVLIVGLLCPVLYATGVIRWLQKRRATAVMRRQRAV
jgi:uncharacterized iron-regulated membrane protein